MIRLKVLLCSLLWILLYSCNSSSKTQDTIYITPSFQDTVITEIEVEPNFMDKPALTGLMDALIYYNLQYPEIVYAQAILETGHFKSKLYKEANNLFGLYNSKDRRYYKFNHWSESVVAYKEWIQRKYKSSENYYDFLDRINYASDPEYISKLKQIVKKENDKRRYVKRDSIS